ncbi:putative ribonuclease H-like domain-containing protein [Tanacetum coccineum]
MPTFTQTAFSQPAFSQPNQSIFSQPVVHFQQTQPTQTNQTGQQYPNNVQSQHPKEALEKMRKEIHYSSSCLSLMRHVCSKGYLDALGKFGGNEESKKMRKTMLKQQFTEFSVTEEEGLHKGYDRFQKILSQLNQVIGVKAAARTPTHLSFLVAASSWAQSLLIQISKSFVPSFYQITGQNKTGEVEKVYGMMAGLHADKDGAGVSDAASEFAMMGISPKYPEPVEEEFRTSLTQGLSRLGRCQAVRSPPSTVTYMPTPITIYIEKHSDKSSDSKTYASCDSSLKTKTHMTSHLQLISRLARRNRPAVNSAGIPNPTGRVGQAAQRAAAQSNPVGWSKNPASVSAGRPVSAGTWGTVAGGTAVKTSAGYSWRNKRPQFWGPKSNGGSHQSTWVILGGIVKFGGGDGRISGKGTIKTSKLDFENVYYVEELQHFNLFSVSQICDKKNKVLFTDTDCLVLSEEFQIPDESQVVLRIPRERDLYTFSISELQPEQNVTCLVAKASLDESTRWHRRMAHVNFKTINKLAKEGLVDGLPLKVFTNEHNCVACNKGKQHKASYKHISAERLITETLQLLHMDLFGPTNIRSIDQKYYSLVVTDDFSRCDNGTEFKNAKLIELCGEKGIKRDYSNPRTPQQNGVAERKNRTLIEAARTMLADSKLPTMFWTEAVSTACYVLNRVSITNPHNKTPYELISGKVPQIGHLKPFGCQVTILNTSDHLGKFEGKADEGYLVGYAPNSKAYRVYNLTNKRVEETMNLRFLEDKPNVQGIGHEWYFDLDYLTDSLGYTRFKTDKPAGTQETNINAGTQDHDSDSEVDEQVIVVPSFPSNSFAGPSSSNGPSVMERNADYAEELAKLQRQEYEAKDAAARYGYLFSQATAEILSQAEAEIRNQGVSADRDPAGIDSAGGVSAGSASAGSDSAGGNPAGSFPPAVSYEPAGQGNPAVSTSVSADFIPVHADESTLPPGQSLGSSENNTRFPVPSDVCKDQLSSGIFTSSSYDDDFSATLTNLAPAVEVNPVPTKRVNTIHPQSQILGDLASPVLTRSRAQKSKFGESAFIGYIQDQQRTNHTDQLHCLFACFLSQLEPTSIAKALEDPDWVAAMQEEMQQFINQKVWKLVPLPDGKHAIGTKWILKNKRDARGIVVRKKASQTSMLKTCILSSTWNLKLQPHPMKLLEYQIEDDTDPPVIHQVTPLTSHLNTVKKIFKYLKGQPKLGLWYPKDSPFQLEAYSDSDYAGSHGDRKSTTGGCQFLVSKDNFLALQEATIWLYFSTRPSMLLAASCCAQVDNTAASVHSSADRIGVCCSTMDLLVAILSAGHWFGSAGVLGSADALFLLVAMDYAADSVYMLVGILLLVDSFLLIGCMFLLSSWFLLAEYIHAAGAVYAANTSNPLCCTYLDIAGWVVSATSHLVSAGSLHSCWCINASAA